LIHEPLAKEWRGLGPPPDPSPEDGFGSQGDGFGPQGGFEVRGFFSGL
jgi:hypothetical protein